MDIKKHFVGRDGFVWWVGQVVDETTLASNAPCSRTGTTDDQSGFSYRSLCFDSLLGLGINPS